MTPVPPAHDLPLGASSAIPRTHPLIPLLRPLAAGVLILLPLLLTLPVHADDVMRVHFIDVGQGDATLVELPCGSILIDAGGEKWPKRGRAQYEGTHHLVDYLTRFFDRRTDLSGRLDLLLLTHPHLDHTRGVPEILSRFRPRNVIYNGVDRGSGVEGQRQAVDYARRNADVDSWYVLERLIDKTTGLSNPVIDSLDCGSVDPQVRALWGQVESKPSRWGRKDFKNGNNHSIAVRLDFGQASVLWTGDLEEGEDTRLRDHDGGIESLLDAFGGGNLLDVDVYQVGHHGSHNGTTPELLAAVSPEMAVISAGPAGCERRGYTAYSFGHPRETTVRNLEAHVAATRSPPASVRTFMGQGHKSPQNLLTVSKAIYSTGWDGTIVLEARPDGTWELASTSGLLPCID